MNQKAPHRPRINAIAGAVFFAVLMALTITLAPDAEAKKRKKNKDKEEIIEQETQIAPPLWRLNGNRGDITILAALHFEPTDIEWRSRDIARAFDGAESIWLEVDGQSPSAQEAAQRIIRENGANKAGVLLSDFLPDEDKDRLTAFATEAGAPIDALEGMAPWQAYLAIGVHEMIDSGRQPGAGISATLSNEAIARGRRIRFLETLENQLTTFSNLPEEDQAAIVSLRLNQWPARNGNLDEMANAWAVGDTDRLDALMNEPLRNASPAAYDALIRQKNAVLAERLSRILDNEPGRHFLLLNAANLSGPDSVIAMLRSTEVDVERIGALSSAALPKIGATTNTSGENLELVEESDQPDNDDAEAINEETYEDDLRDILESIKEKE